MNVPTITRNLHTNPELGVDATSWSGVTGTFTRANDDAPAGFTWGAKLVSTGAAGNAIYAGYMNVTAGRYYHAKAQVKIPVGIVVRVYAQFWDASSALTTDFLLYTGTGAWAEVTYGGIAPVGTTRLRMGIYANAAHAASSVLRMTNADYREGLYQPGFLSGTQPGGTWEGTAHASTSVRVMSLSGPLSGKRDSYLITITEAGGDSPVRIPVNGIDCSWRIGRRGDLSVEIETDLLRRAGLLSCRGYWVRFRVPEMGTYGNWAGVIQRVRHDGQGGVSELAAQTKESLLDARRTARQYDADSADAGGLAAKIIAENAAEGSSYIRGDRIGVTGLVALQVRAEMVVDAVEECARAANAEWRVTHDEYFEFTDRIGIDRGGDVVLVEGRDFSPRGWETIDDLGPVVTDLLAQSGVEQYRRKTAVVVLNEDLAETIGQRQMAKVFPYAVKESQLRPTAKAALAKMGKLGRGATIDVLNTRHIWSTFGGGDSIRVRIPSRGASGTFRVMARVWSSSGNRLTISGEWS